MFWQEMCWFHPNPCCQALLPYGNSPYWLLCLTLLGIAFEFYSFTNKHAIFMNKSNNISNSNIKKTSLEDNRLLVRSMWNGEDITMDFFILHSVWCCERIYYYVNEELSNIMYYYYVWCCKHIIIHCVFKNDIQHWNRPFAWKTSIA